MSPRLDPIVHFCLPPGTAMAGHERPAMVTRVNDGELEESLELCDLTVFPAPLDLLGATMGIVGVQRGFGAGQWHSEDECPKNSVETPGG